MRIHQVIAAIALAVTVAAEHRADAQMAVADAGNLVQNTATALSTAQTVLNTLHQLETMRDQLRYQLQSLQSINPTTFSGLQALLFQSQLTYNMLQGDLRTVGYNVQTVSTNFNRLFPKDAQRWRGVRYSDYDGYYTEWHREITASSEAAVRSQTSVANLDATNRQVATILNQAQGAAGEVRQLQLINQQLAIIAGHLATLVQNLATMGRVVAEWSASSSGEKLLERDARHRRLEGYRDRGRPPQRLNRLP
jgi:P-type conjugative transfer protein TrbJ